MGVQNLLRRVSCPADWGVLSLASPAQAFPMCILCTIPQRHVSSCGSIEALRPWGWSIRNGRISMCRLRRFPLVWFRCQGPRYSPLLSRCSGSSAVPGLHFIYPGVGEICNHIRLGTRVPTWRVCLLDTLGRGMRAYSDPQTGTRICFWALHDRECVVC